MILGLSIVLTWFGLSFVVGMIVGRFIRFGMSGELPKREEQPSEGYGGIFSLNK